MIPLKRLSRLSPERIAKYLIDNGHKKVYINSCSGFWRAGRCGYVTEKKHAGVYSLSDAYDAIGHCDDSKGIEYISAAMKIYISGKITGLSLSQATEKFEQLEQMINASGHVTVNPMKVLPFHPDHDWKKYMVADIEALMECDAIMMMDNWTDSKGAKIEHAIAERLGLKLFYNQNHTIF